MDRAEYDRNRVEEDRHWWFAGRNRLVLEWLARYAPRARTVLDAGCGTGGMLARLRTEYAAAGVERSAEGAMHCRDRGLRDFARGDVQRLPFGDASFDAVVCLDVIYHRGISDDVAALRELARCLRPGGTLVVTVAALELLRSAHDDAVHTRERYTTTMLSERMERAGFDVVRLTYTQFLLSPLLFAAKLLGPRHARAEADNPHWKHSPLQNGTLGCVQWVERGILRYMNLPIGSTVLAVGRKPVLVRPFGTPSLCE